MSTDAKLTIASLFVFLRRQLLQAREEKDTSKLEKLAAAVYLLNDAALDANDSTLIGLTDSLEDSIRDSFMGVEWKSEIPTEDDLKRLLYDHN